MQQTTGQALELKRGASWLSDAAAAAAAAATRNDDGDERRRPCFFAVIACFPIRLQADGFRFMPFAICAGILLLISLSCCGQDMKLKGGANV